jgi:hypothetical protein
LKHHSLSLLIAAATAAAVAGSGNPKLLVVEEVGDANFHGFIFLWVREDEIFVNFKLGNHKD